MTPPSQPHTIKRQTIEQAIYANTKALRAQLEPVAALASMATDPLQPNPIDLVIQLLETLVTGQSVLREEVEKVHARLDEPTVKLAIKQAIQE